MTLDGTLYVDEDGQPWMVFCHEWKQASGTTHDNIGLMLIKLGLGDPQ